MNELVERHLTGTEIRQRQVDHLRLLQEIDNYNSEVDEHKRCVKEANTEIARLQVRERDIRKELRSGTVWEVRQQKMGFSDPPHREYPERSDREIREAMGIDGNSDDPDPETDPAERDADGNPLPPPAYPQSAADQELERKFEKVYPVARDAFALRADLGVVLQRHAGSLLPSAEAIRALGDPVSIAFQKVAGWVCYELADMNRSEHPEFDSFLLTSRQPMPAELAALVKAPAKKKRAPRKPKADPSFHGEHVD